MTLNRAIHIAQDWAAGRTCTLRNGEVLEYHKLVLDTLRAQVEEEKQAEGGKEADLQKYKDAIQRQGKFGQLFVEYKGCPRGPMGRAFCPLEDEVLSIPVIEDVDGGRWVPVNANALDELVNQYRTLKGT